jgi:hypothetical protein
MPAGDRRTPRRGPRSAARASARTSGTSRRRRPGRARAAHRVTERARRRAACAAMPWRSRANAARTWILARGRGTLSHRARTTGRTSVKASAMAHRRCFVRLRAARRTTERPRDRAPCVATQRPGRRDPDTRLEAAAAARHRAPRGERQAATVTLEGERPAPTRDSAPAIPPGPSRFRGSRQEPRSRPQPQARHRVGTQCTTTRETIS